MRCFTEEWYQVAQFMDFYENLEESEQAAVFSEAYFQELYALREADMLEMQKLLHNPDKAPHCASNYR